MNGPVIFLEKGKKVKPSISGTNLVTRYGFPEGYCVITNKVSYLDYDTWVKLVKVVASDIRKIQVINVACVFSILFFVYITLHPPPSQP